MVPSLPRILFLALLSAAVQAQELPRPEPIGKPATKIYRQKLPDGRILYSDKVVKGARVQETIAIELAATAGTPSAPTSGASSTGQRASGGGDRVATIPSPVRPRTLDDANADVMRAEMLLEDARKRMAAGAEPLPGERIGTAGGGSRLSDDYHARQKRLAEEVAVAENVLRKSVAERDAVREGR